MSQVSGTTERVRLLLLRGELPAGALVLDTELADGMHVRRWVMREALGRLTDEGLLVAAGDDGLRVRALNRRDVAEATQVRGALEAMTAELVAASGGVELDRLQALADRAAEVPGDPLLAAVADRDFHRALSAAAGNGLAHATLQRAWDRLLLAVGQGVLRPTAGDADHVELLAAIRAGDPEEAAALARRHALR